MLGLLVVVRGGGLDAVFVGHEAGADEFGAGLDAELIDGHLAFEEGGGFEGEEFGYFDFALEGAGYFGAYAFDCSFDASCGAEDNFALGLDVAFNYAVDSEVSIGLDVAGEFGARANDVWQSVLGFESLAHY